MPLYEYQCESCHKRLEKIQKFSDPPLETCPSCGGRLNKLLSSPAIQFKGSGWYITDYSKKSGDTGTTKSTTASSTESDKSSGTTTSSASDTAAKKD